MEIVRIIGDIAGAVSLIIFVYKLFALMDAVTDYFKAKAAPEQKREGYFTPSAPDNEKGST